jgi:hypothetical protein
MYDLLKTFGSEQILYKVFDSMSNDGKGAFWLSETKEIKNPYMGKAMLTRLKTELHLKTQEKLQPSYLIKPGHLL